MHNISKEDYLSIIFKHKDENNEIKSNVIAEKLNISSAAVTDMLKKLSKEGHLEYEKYKAVKLTQSGETYALNMVRRHRIWEFFLYKIVEMPWDKVHDEAHRLEHSSSDELIDRLDELLGFPEYDPHGDPIPQKNGRMPKMKKHIPLVDLKEGCSGKVVRVNDYNNKFLNYISGLGIKLNQKITVEEKRDFDKSLKIIVNGQPWNISDKLAENVFVEVTK